MIISRKEYETMKAVIDSLNWTITHKNNEIARLKEEIARNDRDIRALRLMLRCDVDLDFPNTHAEKGVLSGGVINSKDTSSNYPLPGDNFNF